MLHRFAYVQLLLIFSTFLSQYGVNAQRPNTTSVEIVTFRYDYDEKLRLIYLMRTGYPPKIYSTISQTYHVANIECDKPDNTFSFSISDMNGHSFSCPKHDGSKNLYINQTHGLMCPTYCAVCKKVYICAKQRSLSGILYTVDGRKKDQISFQYGTLLRENNLEIKWFILTCYIFLFTLFTNIVAFVFTD